MGDDVHRRMVDDRHGKADGVVRDDHEMVVQKVDGEVVQKVDGEDLLKVDDVGVDDDACDVVA